MPAETVERRAGLAIVGLMAAGLALRITSLDLTVYNIDEASLSIFALQLAHLRHFPLIGIETSLGFHNPPLFIHLMAPFFLFTADPRWAMGALALGGTLAIGLTALTAWRLWGAAAAITAGAVVAFSPNAVEHCRRLWGHDTIILWAALCCHGAVRGVQDRKPLWLVISLGAAAAAQACHLSGVFLWLIPLGALLVFKPPHGWVSLLTGVGLALLIYLPWFVHEVINGWPDTRIIVSALWGSGELTGPPSPVAPHTALMLLLADGGHSDLLYGEHGGEMLWRLILTRLVFALLLALALASVFSAVWRRDRRDRWTLLFLCALIAPLPVFGALGVEATTPYFLPASVPGALLAAWALRRVPWPLVGAVATLIAVAGLGHVIQVRSFVARATPDEQVSSVLRFKRDAVAHIVDTGNGEAYAIMQDGRAPEAGLDLWVVHIHHWVSGGRVLPRAGTSPCVFVIVDNKSTLRPAVAAWLHTREPEVFGTLLVFRLGPDEAEVWRALTRRYSTAPAPG